MGGAHSDYKRGDMEIDAQRGTFDGFMGLTIYGGALLALGLIFAILTVGGVGLSWFPALATTLLLGIIAGLILKLKSTWYASIVILSAVIGIVCFLSGLIFG